MAKTLTKRDLVNKISAETNFTQIEVFDIVQRAVDIISSTLAEGDRVVIRNFGTFQVKEVKPKVGRNPRILTRTCRFRPAPSSNSRSARN